MRDEPIEPVTSNPGQARWVSKQPLQNHVLAVSWADVLARILFQEIRSGSGEPEWKYGCRRGAPVRWVGPCLTLFCNDPITSQLGNLRAMSRHSHKRSEDVDFIS